MKKLIILLLLISTILKGQVIPGVVASSRASGATSSTLLTGLISAWEFDEISGTVVYDATNTLNLANSNVTINQTGKIGKCYLYNGTTSYTGWADTQYELATAVSISCWFKTTTVESTVGMGLVGNYHWEDSGYDLITFGNNLYWSVRNPVASPGRAYVTGTTTITTGDWFHVVCTFDGTNAKMYLNGVQEGGTSASWVNEIIYHTNSRFVIGKRYDELFYTGSIDAVRVWNKALSPTEITELYTKENAGTTYPW